MLSRASCDQAEGRIGRVCDADSDARGLRIAVLNELRAAVPFDAYAWMMTDPDTYVGSSPLADVPCLPELPTLIRLKYLTEVNRWTNLPGSRVARLHRERGGVPARCGCWASRALWRAPPARPFGDDEAAFLARLVSPLTAALRRSQAATFT